MAHSTDIVGYTYKADQYCPGCIIDQVFSTYGMAAFSKNVETALTLTAENLDIDRFNESSYDSDEFPKVIFRDQVRHGEDPTDDKEGWDPTDRCGCCGEILGD
jgi:hypothetical protein